MRKIRSMKRALPLMAIFLWITPALADPNAWTLTAQSGRFIFVWRDSAALHEVQQMLVAKVQDTHPELFDRLATCRAADGSKVIVTDHGWTSSDIVIVGGPNIGCRGTVTNEYLVPPK